MIHGVVGIRWGDAAGVNAVQRVGTSDALEVQILEILRRRGALHYNVGNVVPIRDSDAGKAPPQRVAGRHVEPAAVLRIVEKIAGAERVVQRNQIPARQNGSLAALIVVELPQVHDETKLQGLVQKVRLG